MDPKSTCALSLLRHSDVRWSSMVLILAAIWINEVHTSGSKYRDIRRCVLKIQVGGRSLQQSPFEGRVTKDTSGGRGSTYPTFQITFSTTVISCFTLYLVLQHHA